MTFTEEKIREQFRISEKLFYSEFVPKFDINYGPQYAIKTVESISKRILFSVSKTNECNYIDLNNFPEDTKYLIGYLKFKWSNIDRNMKYINRSFYLSFIFNKSGLVEKINFGNIILTSILFERYSIRRSAEPKPEFIMQLSNGLTIKDKCSFAEYFRYINEINLGKFGQIETQKEYKLYKLYLLERDKVV